METKDIIFELRTKMGLSQDELAEKVLVTRQAVSRWENGETIPNTETLKLLSEIFGVSINTLLGSPRKLVCECCGMPIDDANISREKDGAVNESYCGWCYADGEYTLDFFEKYKELGGKYITIGSDSHTAHEVGAGIEEAIAMAKRCGFDKITFYVSRQAMQIDI